MMLNQKVANYIEGAQEKQIVILEKLRTLIHETVTGVSEEIKWGFPAQATTKKMLI